MSQEDEIVAAVKRFLGSAKAAGRFPSKKAVIEVDWSRETVQIRELEFDTSHVAPAKPGRTRVR